MRTKPILSPVEDDEIKHRTSPVMALLPATLAIFVIMFTYLMLQRS